MIKADDGFLRAKLEIAKVVTGLSVDELIHLECRLLATIRDEIVGVGPKHIKITRRVDPELGKAFDVKIYGETMGALPEDKAPKLTTRCFFKIDRQKVE